jgi:hypothetical protein
MWGAIVVKWDWIVVIRELIGDRWETNARLRSGIARVREKVAEWRDNIAITRDTIVES